MLRGSAPAGSRASSLPGPTTQLSEMVFCAAFSRRPRTSRISRASSGTTRGSASSAASICATSVGVSCSSRSSTRTARARSIAAPSTKDVTSCCWALAASRMDSSASGEIRMFRRAERSGVWVGFMACLRTVTVCTACVRGQPGLVKVVRRFLIASLRPFPARRRGNRRPGTSRARQPASPERPPSRRCLARRPARSAVGEHDAEVTSRFGWFDTDGAQRRRMMEVVDLLRDEGTIDELGIGAIYWALLGRWGIRVWDEGVEGHLRRTSGLRQLRAGAPVADDPEAYEPVPVSGFLLSLPRAPEGLLTATDFRLTVDEGEVLSGQIRASTRGSLLAWLVDHPPTEDVSRVWELGDLTSAPPAMVSLVDHARRLHTAIHGAPLLYNLLLAEESGRGALVDAYRGDLIEWSGELQREAVFDGWDRAAFWATILTLNPRIHPRTRAFVNAWLDIAATTTDVADLPAARDLVTSRERQIKGARARLGNRPALERWSGASGLVRLSYRWHVAQRLIADLHGTDGAGDARP